MAPAAAALDAAAAASRTTVRIVPSTGRRTASYAAADAELSADATARGPTSTACSKVLVNPRRIWLRITPELPRAPMSEPWATARQVATSSAGTASISVTTASRVRAMLVPVSPSGTG